MCRFCDSEFSDANPCVEMAKVAVMSCMHNCISSICGGNEKTGKGCRFDFPKKTINHTVLAIMQVNSSHLEVRVLLCRTCTRVPNLKEYFLYYWQGNHDMSLLINITAHKCHSQDALSDKVCSEDRTLQQASQQGHRVSQQEVCQCNAS